MGAGRRACVGLRTVVGFGELSVVPVSGLEGIDWLELNAAARGDPHAGWSEFGRPHRGLPAVAEGSLVHVEPKVGRLLLFPSYVFHRTRPFEGDGDRISISFDLAAAR